MADAVSLFPAGILAVAGLVILLVGRAGKGNVASGVLCGAALVLAGIVSIKESATEAGAALVVPTDQTPIAAGTTAAGSGTALGRALTSDGLSQSGTGLALALGLLMATTANDGGSRRAWRRLALLLFSASGVLLGAIANDLIVAVIAMELASLPATILCFLERDNPEAVAGAKQFLALHLFAAAMLVGGTALIALFAGTTNLSELRAALPPHATGGHLRTVSSPIAGEIATVLLLAGLGVHWLAAPFQLAAGEIFSGAKWWSIGLTAIFPRGASLLLMVRVLVEGPPRLQGTVQTLLTGVGFLSLLIGSLLVVSQVRLRRLLAFMIVFQGGLILTALSAGCSERVRPMATPWLDGHTPGGVGSACLCFAFDSLSLVGLLAMLALREKQDTLSDDLQQPSDAERFRLRGTLFAILLASLAGLPPFAGFWSRVAILRSLLSISFPAENGFLPHQNVDYVVIAIIAAGGLTLIAAIVLGLVKNMLLDVSDAPRVAVLPDVRNARATLPERSLLAVGLLAALAVVLFGALPGPAMRFAAWGTAVRQDSADRAASSSQNRKGTRSRRAARGGLQEPDDEQP